MQITIACASDDGYAMPLAACLASALHYLEPPARLRIFVLDAGISAASRDKLHASLAGDRISLELIGIGGEEIRKFIVHYASVPKPWHWGYGYHCPYSSYFFFALALTAWKGWQPPVRMRQVMRARYPQAYEWLKKLVRQVRTR